MCILRFEDPLVHRAKDRTDLSFGRMLIDGAVHRTPAERQPSTAAEKYFSSYAGAHKRRCLPFEPSARAEIQ